MKKDLTGSKFEPCKILACEEFQILIFKIIISICLLRIGINMGSNNQLNKFIEYLVLMNENPESTQQTSHSNFFNLLNVITVGIH